MRRALLIMIAMAMVYPLAAKMGCTGTEEAGVLLEEKGPMEPAVTPAYDLTGRWGSATIQQSDDRLTVTLPGRGPFQGWYVNPYTIAVTFVDDPGCCTGDITGGGEVIRWSNGTIWVKS